MHWSKGLIAAWACVGFLTLAVIVVFVVIKITVDETVKSASEMCSENALTYDYFKDPPTQSLEVWVYNLTNPAAFLTGQSGADMYELGPYVFDLDISREDIEFFEGESKISLTLFNQLEYEEGDSCVGCGDIFEEKITTISAAYSAMLSGASNEENLLLATSCTPQQLRNVFYNPTAPFCEKTDLSPNVNANCKCCVPDVTTLNMTEVDPDESLAYCSDLADPYGAKGSLISWLAYYDGGYKLTDIVAPQSFPLSNGMYSPLVRTYTINEMLSGSVSSLAGLFNYAALSSQTDEESVATIDGILATTVDIKEVCYSSSFNFCPALEDVLAGVMSLPTQQERIAYLRAVQCVGQVPDYEDLIEAGFEEERALQLRYLEGVSCQQFAVAIAFGALVSLNPTANAAVCADGGAMPCCMSQFSLNNGAQVGKGMGCLCFVDGLLQRRRVFSGEEARELLGSSILHKTSCANSDRLKFIEYNGKESIVQWFTPSSYTYPNMPWADPVVVNNAGTTVPGEFTSFDVSDGRVVTASLGAGLGKTFLQRHLNSGEVKQEEFDVFLPGLNRVHTVQHDGNDEYDGLRVSRFSLTAGLTSPSAVTQGNGQNPYPNLVNMIYNTEGVPAILSLANFLGVDENIYQQSSNAKRGYIDYVGMTMYRTHEKYTRKADPIEPEPFTILTARDFSEDFSSYWEFEPASGLTVSNQVSNMFSLFTLNCNPNIDPTCTLARSESDEYCYPTTVGGEAVTSPCSAANVYTPKVQGEKILPVYWTRINASPPEDALYAVTSILDVRYAFSILIIVMLGLLMILLGYTIFVWKRESDPASEHGGSTRDSVIDMTFRKSAAASGDREVSLDEEANPMQK